MQLHISKKLVYLKSINTNECHNMKIPIQKILAYFDIFVLIVITRKKFNFHY